MMQRHRISTDIGRDQRIVVELKQDYDLLEILSLKFTQADVYSSMCSDYGVVVGRISVNNGFGVPNAKVSIFIPLDDTDALDPVISTLYPYTTIDDKNENNYRYNLLPSRKQHGGHEPTGTFPDQMDILTREEVLEVYEKYYKYTVKTNESGDFMIWGVPIGTQTLHVDVDLSDIGCFSFRPDDFIRLGTGLDAFKNEYSFKKSSDIDSLPQIVTFNQTIEVYPFWGNEDLCEIGITRSDFDLSSKGVRIEPKAYLIGGAFTDSGKAALNKNCAPKKKMGQKCDLTTKTGNIRAIRFTPDKDENYRPILEEVEVLEEIDENGSFMMTLPMNMDFVYTNEYGENEYTNDPNKGIATSSCYRFKFMLNDDGLEKNRGNADYLVPNIREYTNNPDKSYAFSIDYDDYPQHAVENYILNVEDNSYYPKDYFYRVNYNKVYTVSSFQGSYFKGNTFRKDNFLGLKELVPTEEQDCTGEALTPPVNYGFKNYNFSLLIADVLLLFEHLINILIMVFSNVITNFLHAFAEVIDNIPLLPGKQTIYKFLKKTAYRVQNALQRKLYLITYPDCEECNESEFGSEIPASTTAEYCEVGTIDIYGDSDMTTQYWDNLGYQYRELFTEDGSTPMCPLFNSSTSNIDCEPALITGSSIYEKVYLFISNQDDYALVTPNNDLIPLQVGSGDEFDATFQYDNSDPLNPVVTGFTMSYLDGSGYLTNNDTYGLTIVHKTIGVTTGGTVGGSIEAGCALYDEPYDESMISEYFYSTGSTECARASNGTTRPSTVSAVRINDNTNYRLVTSFDGESYQPSSCSGYSEFSNGIFYFIPGGQTSARIFKILKEYRRRKRVGVLFCGGIVNYGFIDNWLSGSLYFFQFKRKVKWDNEEELDLNYRSTKYCDDLLYYKVSEASSGTAVKSFYYRSAPFNQSTGAFGTTYNSPYKRLLHPTTMVDLGPRDEFIKEICTDPNLDPNCSVVRSIGPTSFKSFGDIFGLAINYRLDVADSDEFSINQFFDNEGFQDAGFPSNVLDGDILQIISINNEVGIEEFNLQSPKYLGYTFDVLDPETYPEIFTGGTGNWGPLPITMEFSDDGQRVRLCINEPDHIDNSGNPVNGRLTEASQEVPFFLWDKKGTGFGSYVTDEEDDQSWDYGNIEVQPLQGMTKNYTLNNAGDDSSDRYLLMPITKNTDGLVVSTSLAIDAGIDFDVIEDGTDNHTTYDSQYPGFTYLFVTGGTVTAPTAGTLYVRYGTAGTWQTIVWDDSKDFIIKKSTDYYSSSKQILSTPFLFYFGLRPGRTGIDKFIKRFGPLGAFPSAD